MLRRSLALLSASAAIAGGMAVSGATHAYANHYRPCHDSTALHDPNDFGRHGNPITGIPPKGYYYLDIVACSGTITGVVQTMGDWHLELKAGLNHANIAALDIVCPKHGGPSTMTPLVFTGAVPGHVYRFRVQNTDTQVVTDTSDFSS